MTLLTLADLDTPFPRPSSLNALVRFSDGNKVCIKTNMGKDAFLRAFMGQRVYQCYYEKNINRHTNVGEVKGISFF